MLLGAVLALAGVRLLTIGLRGRLVPDRTRCQRCGFDLIRGDGRGVCVRSVEPTSGSGERFGPDGVFGRHGSWGPQACASVSAATLVAIPAATGVSLNRYKPDWLPLLELRWSVRSTAGPIADKLAGRFFADDLSLPERERLLHTALEIHADEDRPWPGALSAVVHQAI